MERARHDQKDALLAWARLRGYEVAWGPVSAVDAVTRELTARQHSGELDAAFARENLAFTYRQPRTATGGWRVVVVAMPRPAHRVTFTVAESPVEAILPPTYVRYRAIFTEIRDQLMACLGSRVELIDAPLKALAARLGLVRYGRNNLAYAPGMGSYLQLIGCVTDANLPIPPGWTSGDPALLDLCETCGACEAACPTGAIDGDRVLLRAERCLTLANEAAGSLPPWLPASAHHCLIGCLHCQRACPENAELDVQDTGVVFTAEETAALLAGAAEPVGPVWDAVRAKLTALGRSEDLVIGRNLRALLSARRGRVEFPPSRPHDHRTVVGRSEMTDP